MKNYDKDPRLYLAMISDRIRRLEFYTSGGKKVFLSDQMIQDAVMHNLEIIGETIKLIPTEYREQHPELPWRSMAALRDILIYKYNSIELPEIWQVMEIELPPVKAAIKNLIPSLVQLEEEFAGEPAENKEG